MYTEQVNPLLLSGCSTECPTESFENKILGCILNFLKKVFEVIQIVGVHSDHMHLSIIYEEYAHLYKRK